MVRAKIMNGFAFSLVSFPEAPATSTKSEDGLTAISGFFDPKVFTLILGGVVFEDSQSPGNDKEACSGFNVFDS